MSIVSSISRLTDPSGCATSPRQLKECQEKITNTLTRLFRLPANGGNPFLFALAGPKPHYLFRTLHGQELPTAATDGKNFYWNPDWLQSLDHDQAAAVMMHESYHVLFSHCTSERAGGLDAGDWNVAVDYIVNGVIETDHETSGRSNKNSFSKIFTGPLGTPIKLVELIEWIDGKRDQLPEKGCFSDVTLHGRSPESIYDQVRQAKANSPRRCKEATGGCGSLSIEPKTGKSKYDPGPWPAENCQQCGAPPGDGFKGMDGHIQTTQTKDEVMGDMMRAADQASSMRGSVPAEIEAALGRLKKPELSARDIIRHCFAQKAIDTGNINDWKRLRRRPTFIHELNEETGEYVPKHRLYIPKKHDFRPKWVALMDTSGSMSDEDIANGVKELQLVADSSEGYVVPCDATPYWDKTAKITNKTDLGTRTQVVGRGGTVFEQFFRELPLQSFGKDVDLVVIITDGDCDQVPRSLMPPRADCLWIITNNRKFTPNFGRVAQLRSTRPLPDPPTYPELEYVGESIYIWHIPRKSMSLKRNVPG